MTESPNPPTRDRPGESTTQTTEDSPTLAQGPDVGGSAQNSTYAGARMPSDQAMTAQELFEYLQSQTDSEPNIQEIITVFEHDFHRLPDDLVADLHRFWYGLDVPNQYKRKPETAAAKSFVNTYIQWHRKHDETSMPQLDPDPTPGPASDIPVLGTVLGLAFDSGRAIGFVAKDIYRRATSVNLPSRSPAPNPDDE